MSEDKFDHPTILDLHKEQTRQAAILELVRANVEEIKDVLVGTDRRNGLVVDVDRLKRSRALSTAVWLIVFTAVVGAAATAVAAMIFS